MSIESAINAFEELFSEKLRVLTPFRAVVVSVSVSDGLVTITRENADSSDGMAYAHLAGFLLTAGDVVACLNYNGQPIILGKIQNAPSTALTFDTGIVVNGGMRIGGAGLATITADTSAGNTAGIANKGGGEYNGYFELTANGTGISTGQVAHIAFASALGNVDYNVILQDYAGNFVGVRAYVRDLATTGFHVGFNTAPVAGTVYKIGYTVIGWPS